MSEETSEGLGFCMKESSQCPTSELELLSDAQPPADTLPSPSSLPPLNTVELRATTEGSFAARSGVCVCSIPALRLDISSETKVCEPR